MSRKLQCSPSSWGLDRKLIHTRPGWPFKGQHELQPDLLLATLLPNVIQSVSEVQERTRKIQSFEQPALAFTWQGLRRQDTGRGGRGPFFRGYPLHYSLPLLRPKTCHQLSEKQAGRADCPSNTDSAGLPRGTSIVELQWSKLTKQTHPRDWPVRRTRGITNTQVGQQRRRPNHDHEGLPIYRAFSHDVTAAILVFQNNDGRRVKITQGQCEI